MYAIVEVAGKQYKIDKGLKLHVDRLDNEVDSKIILDKVLYVNNNDDISIGKPYLEGVLIEALVKDPLVKDKKVIVFKYKNKTGFHKKQGHRHQYTLLEILDIKTAETKESANIPAIEKQKDITEEL